MIIIETPAPPTRERLVLVRERVIVPESRDATPDDLARGGYVTTAPGDYYSQWAAEKERAEKAERELEDAESRAAHMLTVIRERDSLARQAFMVRDTLQDIESDEDLLETATRTRAALARIATERDTLRAELARLTAPGEGSEGEPTDEEMFAMYEAADDGADLQALYRLGVAHERARQQPAKDLREVSAELEAMRTTHDERDRVYVGAIASDDELVTVYRRAAEPLGDEHGVSLRDLVRRCQARGVLAVAARVRQERCLVAQAVAANVDIRVCEDDGGGFMVGVHESGCDEELARCVPAADVPATLARLLGEVSRG